MELDREIDHLYGLDLGAFVAERDAAVRRLRSEGEREGAEQLRRLRKPTVAAWALNRLAHDRAAEVSDLLSCVDELEGAQRQAVEGNSARFREAAEAHRAALEGLVDDAQRILEEAGSASAATLERVRETLHAVSVDPQARELLRSGRLDRERQPGGLDALGLAGAVPVEEAPQGATGSGRRERPRGAREQERGQRTALREARAAVRAADRRVQSARRRLERAEEAAAKATAARDEARAAVQLAESELQEATRREHEPSGGG